ncbi:hypothetical protein HDU83_000261 [Entophlyctis luteolus]|nr:hypothetical protein HDU83_000261 [Entophlyctis luteolus]
MTDFSSKAFWDKRFETETHFEWLARADILADTVARLVQERVGDCCILHIGSGTSQLSNSLRATLASTLDPSAITNLDYSTLAVERGRAMELAAFSDVKMGWCVADLLDNHQLENALSVASAKYPRLFQTVVEKSCADAICCGPDVSITLPTGTTKTVPPVVALAINLASITEIGSHWIVLSYSKFRFDFLDPTSAEFSPYAAAQWKIIEANPVQPLPPPNEGGKKKVLDHVVHQPVVSHTLFVLERLNGSVSIK